MSWAERWVGLSQAFTLKGALSCQGGASDRQYEQCAGRELKSLRPSVEEGIFQHPDHAGPKSGEGAGMEAWNQINKGLDGKPESLDLMLPL